MYGNSLAHNHALVAGITKAGGVLIIAMVVAAASTPSIALTAVNRCHAAADRHGHLRANRSRDV
jgi:hypothetical protein